MRYHPKVTHLGYFSSENVSLIEYHGLSQDYIRKAILSYKSKKNKTINESGI